MNRKKTIITAVVAVLILIVVLQNTQSVRTNILFFSVEAPRVVLLFVTLAIGFVLGLLSAGGFMKRKKK